MFGLSIIFLFLALALHVCGLTATGRLGIAARDTPDFILPISNGNLTLLSQPNRHHYTLLLLTSSDEQHACDSCRRMQTALRRVAAAWISDYYLLDLLYIAEIDLVDRSNAPVFNYLKLKEVPQLWLVPLSQIADKHRLHRVRKVDEHGIEYFDNFDILLEPHVEFKLPQGSLDDQVFAMADWLAKALQKRINIRQENASMRFVATFAATLSLIVLVKKRGPGLVTLAFSKKKAYTVAFFLCLLVLLGGLLFSSIKAVPFIALNDNREPMYISGGFLYQFGVEMVLVGGVYGLLGISLLALIYLGLYRVSETETSWIRNERQKAAFAFILLATVYLLYSVLTSMFLRKNEEYPYHFTRVF